MYQIFSMLRQYDLALSIDVDNFSIDDHMRTVAASIVLSDA